MADREKVIRVLSHFPTNTFCAEGGEVTVADVLALLKAQEPRVITAEELEDWLEPAYLEDIFYGGRWALIADFSANWFIFNVTEPGFLKEEEFHVSEYGRRWRCWTSRPTDEQRKAVKWV